MRKLVKIMQEFLRPGACQWIVCRCCGERAPAVGSWADASNLRHRYCNPCVLHRMPEGPRHV